MLQKHVDVCREEDDSNNIMLDNVASYDSEEEEEDEDEDEDEDEEDPLCLSAEGMWLFTEHRPFTFALQSILQFNYTPRFGF